MSDPLVTAAPWVVGLLVIAGATCGGLWLCWLIIRWLDRESRAALDAIAERDDDPKPRG